MTEYEFTDRIRMEIILDDIDAVGKALDEAEAAEELNNGKLY